MADPVVFNPATQTPIKLDSSNYSIWKVQMETLFYGYDVIGFVDGSKPAPTKHVQDGGTSKANPEYAKWRRQDSLILHTLIASCTLQDVSFLRSATTSYEAWEILKNTYAKPSRARINTIKQDLRALKRGTQSVTTIAFTSSRLKACSYASLKMFNTGKQTENHANCNPTKDISSIFRVNEGTEMIIARDVSSQSRVCIANVSPLHV